MYKAIKDNKIIAIANKQTVVATVDEKIVPIDIPKENHFPCLVYDEIIEDIEHTVDDYDQYNGEYLLKPEIPAPTREEQSAKREQAYIAETDPIQTHIDRLKDMEQTPEIIAEIEELRIERDEKIAAIKQRYPYPTDPII